MAKPSLELIAALRETADRLDGGVKYQWAHMGNCNCGHLAQTLTRLEPREIHRRALVSVGDWEQQVSEYCPSSQLPLDRVMDTMLAAGLTTCDIADLERLRNDEVLAAIGRRLDHRVREDAVLYLRTWADLLERRWRDQMAARATAPRRQLEPN